MPTIATLAAVLTPTEFENFFPDDLHQQLITLPPQFHAIDPTDLTPEDLTRELERVAPDVLLTCWKTPRLPTKLPPSLRYLCHVTGSVRHMLTRAHLERGLLVTNWGTSISRTVAEGALFHTLNCLRRGPHWHETLQHGTGWDDGKETVRSLFQRRVGIHGYGAIAHEFIKLIAPFDCMISVLAPDFNPTEGLHAAASLNTLFAENDIVVELAPLNDATRATVTEQQLRLLPPGGVFVNVARAGITNEADLLRVATEGSINIGLDVYTQEPLPANSPWRGLRQVSLTPHISGPTPDRYRDAGDNALRNLRAYADDQPVSFAISPEKFDTST